jgi:hypothetical protein
MNAELAGVAPSLAIFEWLQAYRALLRCPDHAPPERRAALRAAYRRGKLVVLAVLAHAEGRSHRDATGTYAIALGDDEQPYITWRPPGADAATAA